MQEWKIIQKSPMMNTLIYVLAWSLLASAPGASVPLRGGLVVILFDSADAKRCSERITVFPDHTVQYWYNGEKLWRVMTTGYEATVAVVPVAGPVDQQAIEQTVKTIDKHEYECRYSATFTPDDTADIENALLGLSFRAGRVKRKGDVWYWAR
jgi:hypothetical protein